MIISTMATGFCNIYFSIITVLLSYGTFPVIIQGTSVRFSPSASKITLDPSWSGATPVPFLRSKKFG
jgi:hypothetical protein